MIAFLIRLGAFPFHNWLPDLQSQSPPPIAMLLAGLIPMTGGFGILRVALPLFPEAAAIHAPILMILALIGLPYAGIRALFQSDFRKRVSYTTVANLSVALLGISFLNVASLEGAVYILLSQILIGAMLIFAAGLDHDDFSGIVVFAAIAIPGLCGFIGQLMVLLGIFESSLPPHQSAPNANALLKCLRPAASEDIVELDSKQRTALALLSTAIIFLGIFPPAIVIATAPTLTAIVKALPM
jgi:NADH-quinone oxidoreductase subunit M